MKRHWYHIEIAYMKNNRTLFSQSSSIGLICQSDILRHRLIKRQLAKEIVAKTGVRGLLCNGEIKVTVATYLGRFDGGGPNLRDYAVKKLGDLMNGYFIYSVDCRKL